MEKVWIDVSHILDWKGNLTGIERVEYHIIKYYFEKTDAKFVRWNKHKFVVTDRRIIKNSIVDRSSEEEHITKDPIKQLKFNKISNRLRHVMHLTSLYSTPKGGAMIVLAGLWDNEKYISALEDLSTKTDVIHVVYDMIPLVHSDYVVDFLPKVFGDYVFRILPECKGLLAISESTAKDVKHILKNKGLNTPKIITFRLGDDISRASQAKKATGFEGDFILSVGTVEIRKNHELLLGVVKKFQKQHKYIPTIVIVGKPGWLTENFQIIIKSKKFKEKIIVLNSTTDEELRWLYENCLFTIFPSFYEGWGLPITESLGYGKVTLSSNTSSMPEAGGKYADYFSPSSTNDLSKLINKYLDSGKRQKREAEIRSKRNPYFWDEATKGFASKVKELASEA